MYDTMSYMKRPRKVRSAKISEAVFLGKKGSYTFDVYPLTAELPESAAVFIFSRRKMTKGGHVSHAVSCIGETDSVTVELKKHRRARCVKQNESNVVCVLREDNGKSRSSVLTDIAEARTFGCVRSEYKPTMMRIPDVLHLAAAKIADNKPVRRVKVQKVESDETPVNQPGKRKPGAKAETKPQAGSKKPKTARPKVSKAGTGMGKAAKRAHSVTAADTVGGNNNSRTKARTISAKRAKPEAKPAKPVTTKPKPAAAAKRPAAAKPRARVQGGMDRDRGQHRLPEQKRPARGRAKTRASGRSGSGKKAAA